MCWGVIFSHVIHPGYFSVRTRVHYFCLAFTFGFPFFCQFLFNCQLRAFLFFDLHDWLQNFSGLDAFLPLALDEAHSRPPRPPNPKPGVEESPLWNCSQTVGDRPYVSIGANRNTWAGCRMSLSRSTRTPKQRGRQSATTDWPHHVGSSSGLTTIVVMTLLPNIQISWTRLGFFNAARIMTTDYTCPIIYSLLNWSHVRNAVAYYFSCSFGKRGRKIGIYIWLYI